MKRVLDIVRIQTVNWQVIYAWPLGILGVTFLLNVGIFVVIGDTPTDDRITGALMSIYVVVAIAHLQAITQVFPFAMSLGVTRKHFFAATAIVVVTQAAFFGVVLTALGALERATGGWGVRVMFFWLPFLRQDNLVMQWLVYAVPFVVVSSVAVLGGVVFKRWGQAGMYVASIVTGVVLVALAMLASWQRWWPAIGSFFTTQPTAALVAGYPLVIAALAGVAGLVLIRRATP